LVAKKAPLILLESFRIASDKSPMLSLDLVGDGPLMATATEFVQRHGLLGRVHLRGRLPHADTLALIRRSDVLLHHAVTSADDGDAEGQPLSILEAMAAGLPVIATDHEGIPEVIADGVNGRLVAEGDAEGMGRALLDLARDPERRRRLGLAARETIQREHTADHARQRLLTLLGLPPQEEAP
jgi:colanic acid/amylovoran biosynthesis glycosyltransferase